MKKADIKLFSIVVLGVMGAGFVMSQFADIGPVATARNGYN